MKVTMILNFSLFSLYLLSCQSLHDEPLSSFTFPEGSLTLHNFRRIESGHIPTKPGQSDRPEVSLLHPGIQFATKLDLSEFVHLASVYDEVDFLAVDCLNIREYCLESGLESLSEPIIVTRNFPGIAY